MIKKLELHLNLFYCVDNFLTFSNTCHTCLTNVEFSKDDLNNSKRAKIE